MADPGHAVPQPGKLEAFSVSVHPVGYLASSMPDLEGFVFMLFTSQPAEDSATELKDSLMHQLKLEDQPVFFVSSDGNLFAKTLSSIMDRFLWEMSRGQQQSAFEHSDAALGQLVIFCDLTHAEIKVQTAPRPAPAPKLASAADDQGPAPSGQQESREDSMLNAAANEAVQKY